LSELSAQINLAKHELTELLNVNIGKNFFTFVNEFRLKAVIRRLANPDYDHLTIMAIANDCGFNSKSTFNSLFKQAFGHTPSEYKKKLRDGSVLV
jgi:AraC-like DNA-binding protein